MELWKKLLPDGFHNHVLVPATFEYHCDPSANADKITGFDAAGERCFSCHSFVLTEQGFDADEFPVLVDIYYECVAAWRLQHGAWIRSKRFCDRLDSCNRQMTTLPLELTASVWEATATCSQLATPRISAEALNPAVTPEQP